MGRIKQFFARLFRRNKKAAKPAASTTAAQPAARTATKAPARTASKAPARTASKAPARTASKAPARAATSAASERAQCLAITASGKQCSRSSRDSSKYCGLHKGYRPPTKAEASAAKDTKPTVKASKDTKPSARRSQVTKYGYKLYQNGNRYFFSKKAQGDVSGKPVYTMPSGYTTTRTPNGLPVLKKK